MVPNERTFYAYLREYAAASPGKPLLGSGDGWLTVQQVLELAETTAWHLDRQGIRAGDLVALRTTRSRESILIMIAMQFIGAVVVLADPHTSVRAFLDSCAVSIPVKAIISNDCAVHPIWDGTGLTLTHCHTGDTVPMDPFMLEPHTFPEQVVDAKTPGFIIFTSGSTGKSKAVMLSQYNLVNNLVDSQPLGLYSETDIALGALPLEHVFGLVLMAGIMVLRYSLFLPRGTDIPAILEAIQEQRITRMNGVTALYLAMADQKGRYDLSSLRAGFIGGGPCTPEQFRRIEEMLGITLISVYGMSECVGISCACWADPWEIRASGVGPFYSMNTGRILLEDGSEAVPGQEGEICVDGPSRMVGYYGDTAPRPALFHTGDLGYVDKHGVLHISGRKKDIIIRNGANLSPRRIEDALLSLPDVSHAAVVGLPDAQCGELPYAMVVSSGLTQEEIFTGLKPLLAKNELPAGILIVDSLPLTASGKPHKQKIREVLSKWKKA